MNRRPPTPFDMGPSASDDKQRARLNIISHLLDSVKYEDVPRKKVVLRKRQNAGNYRYKFVPKNH